MLVAIFPGFMDVDSPTTSRVASVLQSMRSFKHRCFDTVRKLKGRIFARKGLEVYIHVTSGSAHHGFRIMSNFRLLLLASSPSLPLAICHILHPW
jgi:hypothetical protein